MNIYDILLDQMRDMSTLIQTGKKKKKKIIVDENDNIRINDDDFYGRGMESILA